MSLSTRKARLQTLAPIFATTLASLVVGGFWAEGEYESQRESAQVSLGALARSLAPDVERLDIGAALTERLEASRLKPDGTIWVIAPDGTVLALAPRQADRIGRPAPFALPPLSDEAADAVIDGDRHLVATAALPGNSPRVVVSVPAAEFFINVWDETALLGALLLATLGSALYAARQQWALINRLEGLNSALCDKVQAQGAELDAEIREREVHEKRARLLGNALEHSGTMVLITGADGRIEYANPAFFQATGFDAADIIGHDPAILRHPEFSPPTETLWPALRAGKSWSGEFCNRRRDGSPLWVSATISPVTDRDGTTTHFVAVEEDATSRRDNEEILRQARKSAEAANVAKSEFLSSMSHELRTPMNAIMGFGQLLADGDQPLGERQRFYAESIVKSGNHLLNLVNDILDMARIEAGRLSLSFERVEPDRVMAEVLPMIESLAARRKVALINEISGQGAPALEADFTRLKQVMINLASNAVKYNRTGGSVRFAVSHGEDGPVRLSVADSGIGIPEKRRAEVFSPFTRLGAEGSMVEGTGIGLTISKMLVEAMGGQIGFFSRENQGTTFWLDLPRAKQAKAPVVVASPPPPSSSAARCGHTLLYVEDNPSNRELMEEILAQDPGCGCRLLCATTAEEGLDLARQHNPDLVIMDVNLPGISGIEAVARMRADPQLHSIPVIALSADVMPDTIRAGMKAGFVRYLRKPLDIAEFRKILRQVGDSRP